IIFFFQKNPYFWNEVVIKEYNINVTGYTATHSTPIQWSRNYEHEAYSHRHHDTILNFFNWFSGPNCSGYNRIAEIIIGDLWLNPVQYYQREGRGREKK
ncbi:testis-specific Y-encoded protein 2-like, partial [Orycteropus afer afer]|uniref:Testis-specific Y-encoded protein 2-like n=1 Tax=Orycteropus afer afer TaxID=1230840 RepID=A0A8B7B704_ORYAF